MAAWVVPGMILSTVKGQLLGNRVEQVFATKVQVNAPIGVTRRDAVQAMSDRIGTGWRDNVLPHLSTAYTFHGVETIDIDSLEGDIYTSAFNLTGANPGEPFPSNVAVVVRKNSGRRRGTRQGRFFLGGVVEAAAAGNTLVPTFQAELQESLDDLWSAWEETGTAFDVWDQPAVIHTSGGEPTGVSFVSSFTVQAKLSHQDRRIRS